eukprot:gene3076-13097_t
MIAKAIASGNKVHPGAPPQELHPGVNGQHAPEEEEEHGEHIKFATLLAVKFGFWKQVIKDVGADVAKQRLQSQWTTLGIVSALLAALTLPSVVAPPIGGANAEDPEQAMMASVRIFYIANAASTALSLFIVAMCTIFLVQSDLCTTPVSLTRFIIEFQNVHELVVIPVFIASILLMIVGLSAAVHFHSVTERRSDEIVLFALFSVLLSFAFVFFLIADGFNKKRLVHHMHQHREATERALQQSDPIQKLPGHEVESITPTESLGWSKVRPKSTEESDAAVARSGATLKATRPENNT